MAAVREAVVDGLFYPAAFCALRAQIVDGVSGVEAAEDATRVPPKLLISPMRDRRSLPVRVAVQ